MLFTFGTCSIDCARRELRRDEELVAIEPQVFDVLVYLIQHRDRVVTRDDLLGSVWGGRIVSESTLSSRINSARSAIGDSGEQQQWIRTIARKGVRFIGEVHEQQGSGAASTPRATLAVPSASSAASTSALPDKPSIAVTPFANLSSDKEQDYFCDGITEDIITELSRFSELFVIARNSSFQYKDKSSDVRQVGRELGVRYVLEGSIRRNGDRVRITAQLIDATSGVHRWAERYDRNLEHAFAVQDEVVGTIVGLLAAHVNKAEIERTLLKPPTAWHAHDHYLRAVNCMANFYSLWRAEELHEARRLLEMSISTDATYARAYSGLSFTYTAAYTNPVDSDYASPVALERAHQFGQRAVQLDPNLPQAHAQLGLVLVWRRQHEAAIASFERAIALNPNFGDWRFAAALTLAGEPSRALKVLEAYFRIDPFYPTSALHYMGVALFMLKRYSDALVPLLDCCARSPNGRPARKTLAATYGHLCRLEDAQAETREILRLEPDYTIDKHKRWTAFKHPEDAEHYFDGLRKAGVPER